MFAFEKKKKKSRKKGEVIEEAEGDNHIGEDII